MTISESKPRRKTGRFIPIILVSITLGILSACASVSTPEHATPLPDSIPIDPIIKPAEPSSGPAPIEPVAPSIPPHTFSFRSSGNAVIDAWRKDFAQRSLQAGYSVDTIRKTLSDLYESRYYFDRNPAQKTASAVENQAEFAKTIWDYVDSATTPNRVARGQEIAANYGEFFNTLRQRYNVDRSALLGIWGMETNYGAVMGSENAANMLANMAAKGRRLALAERELRALMTLIAEWGFAREDFRSAIAGALGHMQFMPTSVLSYATDHDGDGRIELWDSPKDALASAANYLTEKEYIEGTPWGIEVILPDGFDYTLANGQKKTLRHWQTHGVMLAHPSDRSVRSDLSADLWVPAGHTGPKFLLFPNFYVFKQYNNADAYALSVGLLGNAITGKPGLSQPWPRHLGKRTKAAIKDLQSGLTYLGYDPKGIDGIFGRNTANALRRFQADRNMIADGYPTTDALIAVRNAQ